MHGIILSCQVRTISTMVDGGVSVKLHTQELSSGNAAELMGLRNKIAAVYISPKETISQKEIDQLDQVNPEFPNKTSSQRMRNVLYKLWEQNAEGHADFQVYYRTKMEVLISELKTKLEP